MRNAKLRRYKRKAKTYIPFFNFFRYKLPKFYRDLPESSTRVLTNLEKVCIILIVKLKDIAYEAKEGNMKNIMNILLNRHSVKVKDMYGNTRTIYLKGSYRTFKGVSELSKGKFNRKVIYVKA